MASPLFILEKFPPTRRALEDQYTKRAKRIVGRISPFVKKDKKIIDIGSGTGFVARALAKKTKAKITLVDVYQNPLCQAFPITIYDGKTLPFPDRSFDASLLIAVLHHCRQPLEVLDEAIRVSKQKIIVMEDLFESLPEKWLTLIEDSIINWEYGGHPHNNHSEKEWLEIFQRKNLKLKNLEKFRLVCAGFPFRLGIFFLEKSK